MPLIPVFHLFTGGNEIYRDIMITQKLVFVTIKLIKFID